MARDPDILEFLNRSSTYMNANSLERDWENHFVEVIRKLRNESAKASFRRGFAKSVLGQITPREYENATGWDFDTEEEFRAHLKHYWQLFYGSDDPAESV